jgi:hypothetical protein
VNGVLSRCRRTQWCHASKTSLARVLNIRLPETVWIQTELLHVFLFASVDVQPVVSSENHAGVDAVNSVLASLCQNITWLLRLNDCLPATTVCAAILSLVWDQMTGAGSVPPSTTPPQASLSPLQSVLVARPALWGRIGRAVFAVLSERMSGRCPVATQCGAVWKYIENSVVKPRPRTKPCDLSAPAFVRQECAKAFTGFVSAIRDVAGYADIPLSIATRAVVPSALPTPMSAHERQAVALYCLTAFEIVTAALGVTMSCFPRTTIRIGALELPGWQVETLSDPVVVPATQALKQFLSPSTL